MGETVVIDPRFRGPPMSANGGYTCGLLASRLDAPAAEVTLRAPPPLDQPIELGVEDGMLRARAGEQLIAEARAVELDLEPPPPVDPETAAAAAERALAMMAGHHPFPTCYVCGPERAAGDGLRIFAGPLEGPDGLAAAPWTPPAELGGADGAVALEQVWAVLDCPSSSPVVNLDGNPPVVLGRLAARVAAPVLAGEPHVVTAWRIAVRGRVRDAGVVLRREDGEAVAWGRATWIELRPPA